METNRWEVRAELGGTAINVRICTERLGCLPRVRFLNIREPQNSK